MHSHPAIHASSQSSHNVTYLPTSSLREKVGAVGKSLSAVQCMQPFIDSFMGEGNPITSVVIVMDEYSANDHTQANTEEEK
mmetsp:Transcript_7150/g.17403  ORF Transcript_7150/g.17403 Transcript_7150/m.17403 type:complete len:81 (+) Transcript_7150:319-561(+)